MKQELRVVSRDGIFMIMATPNGTFLTRFFATESEAIAVRDEMIANKTPRNGFTGWNNMKRGFEKFKSVTKRD